MIDWTQNRAAMLYEMRLGLGMPRKVTKLKSEHHERMETHWLEHARNLGRPGYHEAAGFAGKWSGHEKPYGPFSRSHWRYVWLAMRAAFLAEWCRSQGTTYETSEGGRRSFAVITGLTA